MKELNSYSLKKHNTFGLEACCRRFLEYETVEEAVTIARKLSDEQCPYIIIGGGSNLLLTQDYEGTVVHSAIKGISVEGTLVSCGSGEVWDDVVAWMTANGLYGAENLSLIPGDVGASAVQNIGAYGAEVKDLIERVWAVEISTGQLCSMTNADCQYGYRQSRFKHDWKNRYLVTSVDYRMSRDFVPKMEYGNIKAELERQGIDKPTPQQLRDTIIAIRNAKLPDPKVTGNAGSFFMNPIVSRRQYEQLAQRYPGMPHYHVDDDHEKIPAGWMIEQCGWKGKSMGRAGVHDKQALVLVNRGGATGADIVALCKAIQHDVKQMFDIDIHPEVNVI